MTPLSKNAVYIFALISANCGNQPFHINRLFRVARQPKAQVEAAMIELMTQEYIQYDAQTQHIFIYKGRRHERKNQWLSNCVD
jgi:hypothetical protein